MTFRIDAPVFRQASAAAAALLIAGMLWIQTVSVSGTGPVGQIAMTLA